MDAFCEAVRAESANAEMLIGVGMVVVVLVVVVIVVVDVVIGAGTFWSCHTMPLCDLTQRYFFAPWLSAAPR